MKKLDFVTLSSFGSGYSGFARMTYRGVKGWIYRMDDSLSDADREEIMKYSNTAIISYSHRYAPEIKGNAVFLAG